jgi:hypothetical protein
MAVTRIKNNQITDATVVANAKLVDYSISSAKLANNLTYNSDLTITGNLTVQGNATSIDTTITTIEDPVITLASTQTSGTPTVDIGFLGYRGNVSNIAFVWDESAAEFVTAFTSTGQTNTTITISSYADFHTNNANIGGNLTLGGNLSITGNVANLTVTGNIAGGNLLTGGLISATGNVTGGNVLTGGLISATSTITSATTITGGNLATGGTVSAAGNVTGGNVLTSGLISATSTITSAANITGGNVLTGGLISATGNISGNYFIGNGSQLTGVIASSANAETLTGTFLANNVVGSSLTSVGNLTALSVVGNTTTGNLLTGGLVSAAGNVTGGNLITAGLISATGNISGGNIISGNAVIGNINVSGDITVNSLTANTFVSATGNVVGGNVLTGGLISSTGNITGANLLTGGLISATGNVTGGNLLTPGLISAAGLATSGNVQTAGIVSATGNINTAGNINVAGNIFDSGSLTITTASGDITLAPAGNINAGTRYINNVINPQQDQDAATKIYVDNLVSTAISYHDAVVAATTGNLDAATGGTVTYNQPNGAGNGIGATLTTTGSFDLIDTANVQSANTRILVKNQANAVQNGVYVWSNATVITRSSDTNTYGAGNVDALGINDYFFVTGGNVNLGSAWIVDAPSGTITFGTSNIQFAQFSSSQTYTANTLAGISLTGTVFSAKVDNNTTAFDGGGNIIVKAGANLTTPNIGAATGTNLNVTGNVQAGNLLANAAVIATGNVQGANINTAGLITATGNVTGGNVLTGGLISATSTITSAANITGGNVLTGGLISATGNATAANFNTAGVVSATGNVTGGNVTTVGLITATGNITGGNLFTSGSGGQISGSGNITGGNLLYGSGIVSGTGNIYATNFIGNISGNIDAAGANTNIQFNDDNLLAGSPGFTFDKVGNVVTANGNIIGANFSTAGLVTATGNVTGGNVLTGGLISATGTITSAANITGGNVLTGGLISATSTITSAANVIAGNVTTAGLVTATGNITGGNIDTAGLITATGNITGANLILTSGIIDGPAAGRITINGSDIDTDFAVDGDTVANVFYVDAGTGTASFGASTQVTNAIVNFASTTSIKAPVGNTAQRPAVGVTGMIRFNTTNNNLELYDNSQWTAVGVPVFTVIADEQFNGDGSTVAFTLSSTQTTNSCIVSINGVVQIPTSAYSVSGTDPTCVLTFTEAPLSGDLIDVRQITTTTTVTSIANSSGNAVVSTSETAAQVNVTGDLSVNGTILGGNINSTAITNGNSSVTVDSSGGNVTVAVAGGNIVSFNSGGIINNQANGVGNIGSATNYFNTVFAKATSAQYADLAEKYVADAEYAPGTVVVFGGTHEVTVNATDADRKVAGVISTNPSYIMNGTLEADHVATVALTGRVPTLVVGPVRKGDLMVSAGLGRARSEADPKVGTVIGKALEDFDGAEGTIEVVVGRF